ncbi:MAG: phosphohistidine phosphatase SixA [candidate division KSB1 bacterium]|nr:phosphohistidine phosphatase SixA [candidate division KSB1 bacterium]MDZ7366244.1 phosphohistidine phosphatase SixA [candidate division KSB1 bacterium]MDZ7404462.1 phosphohistidine phosphatase SixA [candidate division KSB1 bacterium]
MELYIIRHAIAAMREEWTGSDDKRPLTEKGKKKMEQIARGLAAMEIDFTHIFSSPLVRAQQTAEILQKILKFDHADETDLLVPSADPAAMIPFLNKLPDNADVALVGHEPHVSALLSYLLSGEHKNFAAFKKGGVAMLEGYAPLRPGKLVLRWLLEPNHLVAIGEAE